ncbi:MAG TPA: hypothetical protein VFZ32_15000 [Micromonosporaceae bacterium]
MSLLVGVALIAATALWSPNHSIAGHDLAGPRTGALATGIATESTASGIRSETCLAGGRHKAVPLRQGPGLAVIGLLCVLDPPYHALTHAADRGVQPASGEAAPHHRGRAPPGHR